MAAKGDAEAERTADELVGAACRGDAPERVHQLSQRVGAVLLEAHGPGESLVVLAVTLHNISRAFPSPDLMRRLLHVLVDRASAYRGILMTARQVAAEKKAARRH